MGEVDTLDKTEGQTLFRAPQTTVMRQSGNGLEIRVEAATTLEI